MVHAAAVRPSLNCHYRYLNWRVENQENFPGIKVTLIRW
ncbi:hypothetical protein COO91_02029 [Nostoc flagelliforme CCNUN1]|uniref:Uncharacterized protein n=1 Tax=Nostoc flagelliforme CCNUN1 TaxID=2038116 RepID=A0A2K8SL46_9NOSO|nr:hypothetical protein COO91_02029 [Nostoc flagelliforme CCNUN1]